VGKAVLMKCDVMVVDQIPNSSSELYIFTRSPLMKGLGDKQRSRRFNFKFAGVHWLDKQRSPSFLVHC